MRAAFALALVTVIVAASGAQTPPRDQSRVAVAGSAAITGVVVVDDETRAPLRRATVTLSRSGIEDIRSTTSDDEGRFLFAALPPGTYTLAASKGAYIAMSYGAPKPGMPGRSIAVTEGQTFAANPIALMRGAVIAGRITDRYGRALNATVEAVQFVAVNGERRRRSSTGASATAQTNAHGDFRIFGLLPGEYLVSANPTTGAGRQVTPEELAWAGRGGSGSAPPPGGAHGYSKTFFPGSADEAAAVSIRVERGEERPGIDFTPQFIALARVSGLVSSQAGLPVPDVTIVAVPKRRGMAVGTPIRILSGRSAPDGRFTIADLPPGEYVLTAQGPAAGRGGPASSARRLWGQASFSVNGADLPDVAIRMLESVSVSGRLVVKGAPEHAPPSLEGVRVRLVSAEQEVFAVAAGNPSATVGADGSFAVADVRSGLYRIAATVPSGRPGVTWALRSALRGSVDVADRPFDVGMSDISDLVLTLSDNLPELTGALTDQAGQPAPQLYVFAFSTDRSHWTADSRRIASARASEAGIYKLAVLPPGEYYVCALTELDTTLQFEPEYLEQLVPAAIRITLTEGEKKTQNLRIGG